MTIKEARWENPLEQSRKVLKADTVATISNMANKVDPAVAVEGPKEQSTNGSIAREKEGTATVSAEP